MLEFYLYAGIAIIGCLAIIGLLVKYDIFKTSLALTLLGWLTFFGIIYSFVVAYYEGSLYGFLASAITYAISAFSFKCQQKIYGKNSYQPTVYMWAMLIITIVSFSASIYIVGQYKSLWGILCLFIGVTIGCFIYVKDPAFLESSAGKEFQDGMKETKQGFKEAKQSFEEIGDVFSDIFAGSSEGDSVEHADPTRNRDWTSFRIVPRDYEKTEEALKRRLIRDRNLTIEMFSNSGVISSKVGDYAKECVLFVFNDIINNHLNELRLTRMSDDRLVLSHGSYKYINVPPRVDGRGVVHHRVILRTGGGTKLFYHITNRDSEIMWWWQYEDSNFYFEINPWLGERDLIRQR